MALGPRFIFLKYEVHIEVGKEKMTDAINSFSLCHAIVDEHNKLFEYSFNGYKVPAIFQFSIFLSFE